MKSTIIKLGLVASAILLSHCATSPDSAENSTRAAYLDEVWVAPSMRGKPVSQTYTKVYFAPVTVNRLEEQSWWKSQNAHTKDKLAADARRLAGYTQQSMRNAAMKYPNPKVRVAGGSGPGTLIVECSIVELTPAKAFWNSAATAAGFAVPGAGLLTNLGKGSITFEGRLRDGATGAVVATFRDQSKDKSAVLNLDSCTWYEGSEANIDDMARKTAEFLNSTDGRVVKGARPIKLIAF